MGVAMEGDDGGWNPCCRHEQKAGEVPGFRSGPSGEGNDDLLQCSSLGHPVNRTAWWAICQWGHKRVGQTKQACTYQAMRGRKPRGLHCSIIHPFLQHQFEGTHSILLISTFHTSQFLLFTYLARFPISSPSL